MQDESSRGPLVNGPLIMQNPTSHGNTDNFSREFTPIIPYEVRLQIYNERRRQIFGSSDTPNVKASRDAIRQNTSWKNIKNNNRALSKTICSITNIENDLRNYAKIEMLNRTFLGLLDSGAQVSCIKQSCKRN